MVYPSPSSLGEALKLKAEPLFSSMDATVCWALAGAGRPLDAGRSTHAVPNAQ
jgi:hypothetical protein